MRHPLIPTVLLAAACSSPVQTRVGAEAGPGDDVADLALAIDAGDLGAMPDAGATLDDLGTADLGDLGPSRCAALGAAACLADPSCTLRSGCVEASPDDLAFGVPLTGFWDATVVSEGEGGFVAGELAGTLSLFRVDARRLRGVLTLPMPGVSHRVFGGVGPTGELGMYLGPPECDQPLCDFPFGAAYEAAGVATADELSFSSVAAKPGTVGFRTFVSLRAVPHDGFKPVNPFVPGNEELIGNWAGELVAVDERGRAVFADCAFTIDKNDATPVFRGFRCESPPGTILDAWSMPDDASLRESGGFVWWAFGTESTSPLFVARFASGQPLDGVVTTRALWTQGDPIDPAAVDIEDLRGTFHFVASN